MTVGGAGGRRDGTQVRVADLAKTGNDALLKILRRDLRKDYGFPRNAEMEFGAGEHIEDAFMPFFRGGASTRLEALQALYIVIAEFYHHAFIRNPGNEEKRRIFEGYARSSGGIGMRIMCDHIRDPEKLKHAFVGVTNETVASFVAFLRTTRPKMADFWPQVYHHLDLDYPGETESEPMIEKPWWRFW